MLEVFHSKTAQALATWLGIATAILAVLSWLTPQWFGTLTWAQGILVGIAGALTLFLIIALGMALIGIGLALYRRFRPLPSALSDGAVGELDHKPEPYDDAALRAEIADVMTFAEALGEEIGKETAAKIESTCERIGTVDRDLRNMMDALSDKIDNVALMALQNGKDHAEAMKAIAERIDAADAAAKGARDYGLGTNTALGSSIRELIEGQTEARREQQDFQARMEAWVGQLQAKIRYGFRGVDQGFSALLDRERLLEMAADIQKVGDELSAPSRSEPLEYWPAWQAKFSAWNRAVEEWARLADKRRDGVVKRVFDTPSSEYKLKWGVEDYSIFPDHDAVHDYKTFCIISRNFHVERKGVEYGLMLAAFRSPSKKVRGDPEDEDDPMLTLPQPPEDYRE